MARVNVFLKEDLLAAVDREAAHSRMNRSALLATAVREFLDRRRRQREEGERRRAREEAFRRIDRLGERLGKWDAVGVVRKHRETRLRSKSSS